jgi:uncharacterized membrane protein YhaH (DUF805 family)
MRSRIKSGTAQHPSPKPAAAPDLIQGLHPEREMQPAQAIKTCLRKSFQFSGRASRSEYLVCAGVFWLLGTALFHTANAALIIPQLLAPEPLDKLLRGLLYFSFFMPMIALNNAGIRREHDLAEKWQLVALRRTNPFFPATLHSLISAFVIAGVIPYLVVVLATLPADAYSVGLLVFFFASFCFCITALIFVFKRFRLPSFPTPNPYGPTPLEVTP